MLNEEVIEQLTRGLEQARNQRMELLPERGSLIDVVADAMNALEVAFIVISEHASRKQEPGATFVPVSGKSEPKKM